MRIMITVIASLICLLSVSVPALYSFGLSFDLSQLNSPMDKYVIHHWPDPVNVRNGNLVLFAQDVRIPFMGMSLDVSRTYNSRSNVRGAFGYGWTAGFETQLKGRDSDTIEILESNGSKTIYRKTRDLRGLEVYSSPTNRSTVMFHPHTKSFVRLMGCTYQQVFDSQGRLKELNDGYGNLVTFHYTDGRVIRISDSSNRTLTLAYNEAGLVASVKDPAQRVYLYRYDSEQNLIETIQPGAAKTVFAYDELHNLIRIQYPDGGTTSIEYDTQKDLVVAESGPGAKRTKYKYTVKQRDPMKHLTEVTDAKGNRKEYLYEEYAKGLKLTITDALRGKTVKEYDTDGNLLSLTDANGNASRFAYDQQNRLIRVVDPTGRKEVREYCDNCDSGDLKCIIDAMGGKVEFQQEDSLGTTIITDPQGNKSRFVVDKRGLHVKTIDPAGSETNYEYDNYGNPIRVIHPSGLTTATQYDILGRITEMTDARSNKWSFLYNEGGKLARLKGPATWEISFTYDPMGRIKETRDASGHTKRLEYDEAGLLQKESDELGRVTLYTYDANRNLATLKYPRGNQSEYQYDALNRVIKQCYARNQEYRIQYDKVGNVLSAVEPSGRKTEFQYDKSNLLSKIIGPGKQWRSLERDNAGNLVSLTDNSGRSIKYKLDELYRPTEMIEASGLAWKYAYDRVGNLSKLIGPNDRTWTFSRDSRGRLTQEVDWAGRTKTLTYDDKKNTMTVKDETSARRIYKYGFAGQLMEIDYVDSAGKSDGSLRYERDAMGNPTKISNQETAVAIKYDKVGNVVHVRDTATGKLIEYRYDENRNKSRVTIDGASAISYTYDALDRIVATENSFGEKFVFYYDKNGNRSKLEYPNGVTAQYSYDDQARLAKLSYRHTSGKDILSLGYSYDDSGNLVKLTQGDKGTRYEYDRRNRLIKAVGPDGGAMLYEYDDNDNVTNAQRSARATEKMTYDDKDRLLSAGPKSYVYDSKGFLTEIRDAKDKTRLCYQPDGKLRSILDKDSQEVVFRYDPLGNRIAKRSPEGTTMYVYDGLNMILEMDEAKQQKALYSHGPGIDEPLAVRRAADSLFFHADALGTIRVVTDSRGNIVEGITYDPFGRTLSKDTGKGLPYRFTGRILDTETGLYNYRNRYYSPDVGRFIEQDPLEYFTGQTNYYCYAGNNPVMFNDPMGLDFLGDIKSGMRTMFPESPITKAMAGPPKKDNIFRRIQNNVKKLPPSSPGKGPGQPYISAGGQLGTKSAQLQAQLQGASIVIRKSTSSESVLAVRVNAEAGIEKGNKRGGGGDKNKPSASVGLGNVSVSTDGDSHSVQVGPVTVETENGSINKVAIRTEHELYQYNVDDLTSPISVSRTSEDSIRIPTPFDALNHPNVRRALNQLENSRNQQRSNRSNRCP